MKRIGNHFYMGNDNWRKVNVGDCKQISNRPGKLHDNHIVLDNNMISKLMTINKLQLPDVLIDIVKDYLFDPVEVTFHRMLTSRVLEDIRCMKIHPRYLQGQMDHFIYEWELEYYINSYYDKYDPTSNPTTNPTSNPTSNPTFKCYFCSQCGNYSNDYLYEDEDYSLNGLCHCVNHPFHQQHEGLQLFTSVIL